MQVEIWSDVVCPWCYIGKRRFETALEHVAARRDTSSIEIVYRPYQLDPTARAGQAQPVVEAYAKKFGGVERAAEIINRVTTVAAADGIEFRMDRALRANTLLAHRLLWFAETLNSLPADGSAHSQQIALKQRLLEAYFTDGFDIGSVDVLADCAADVGIDRDEALAFLAGDGGQGEVMEALATAAANGITAVPTFVFNGEWALPGAQDVELFERVIDKMLDNEHIPSVVGEACDV
jgi:predicted DsbA family dithiol-disulfide isomerase